jgi:hypothetical protein
VPLVCKAADEIKKVTFFSFSRTNKINAFIVNSNKLTHNLAGMATSGFELDVARGLAIRCGS